MRGKFPKNMPHTLRTLISGTFIFPPLHWFEAVTCSRASGKAKSTVIHVQQRFSVRCTELDFYASYTFFAISVNLFASTCLAACLSLSACRSTCLSTNLSLKRFNYPSIHYLPRYPLSGFCILYIPSKFISTFSVFYLKFFIYRYFTSSKLINVLFFNLKSVLYSL